MDRKFDYLPYFLFARFLPSLLNLIFLILMKLPGKIESLSYVDPSDELETETHGWTGVRRTVFEAASGGVRASFPWVLAGKDASRSALSTSGSRAKDVRI